MESFGFHFLFFVSFLRFWGKRQFSGPSRHDASVGRTAGKKQIAHTHVEGRKSIVLCFIRIDKKALFSLNK